MRCFWCSCDLKNGISRDHLISRPNAKILGITPKERAKCGIVYTCKHCNRHRGNITNLFARMLFLIENVKNDDLRIHQKVLFFDALKKMQQPLLITRTLIVNKLHKSIMKRKITPDMPLTVGQACLQEVTKLLHVDQNLFVCMEEAC